MRDLEIMIKPALAGLDFFRDFICRVQRLNCGCEVFYSLQTNGTLLSVARQLWQ